MTALGDPLHPGEVLSELFLIPLNISARTLAKTIHVPRTRIDRLVKGQISMNADTALRLSAYFGSTAEFWLDLQRAFDLAEARKVVDTSHIRPLVAAWNRRPVPEPAAPSM